MATTAAGTGCRDVDLSLDLQAFSLSFDCAHSSMQIMPGELGLQLAPLLCVSKLCSQKAERLLRRCECASLPGQGVQMELIVLCDRELLFVDLITHTYSYLIAHTAARGCGATR